MALLPDLRKRLAVCKGCRRRRALLLSAWRRIFGRKEDTGDPAPDFGRYFLVVEHIDADNGTATFRLNGREDDGYLLGIQEFADADYAGADELPWRGAQAKKWLGALWMPHSGLTKDGDNVRLCHWYHRTAVGHASGQNVKSDISWHGDRAAWFVSNCMSQGAALIDSAGVVTLRCLES